MNTGNNHPEPPGSPSDAVLDLRRRAEMATLEKNGRVREIPADLSPEAMLRMLHELQVREIELLMQNEELRQAQAELEAANDRYSSFYDLAPVGFCTLSNKGLILEANLTFASWIGEGRGDLVNTPLTKFILPEDQDIYYLHRRQLFETGEPQSCELRIQRRDKMVLWVNIDATVARNPDGEPMSRIVLTDITGRKRTEKALAEKEEMYRLIFNSVPTAIFHYDSKGTIKTCNPYALSLFGLTEDEVIGLNLFEAETDERVLHCVKTALAGTPAGFAGEYTTISGKRIHFDSHNVPIFSDDHAVTGAIVVIEDIADKAQAAQALRESEKNLASIFNAITESVFLFDSQGILLSLNPTAAKRFHSTPENMLGKVAYDFLPEDLANFRRAKIEEVFRTRREVHFEDSRNGMYFKHAFYPVFDEEGKVSRLAVFSQNVTELKIAEEALRESEKNLASMFDAITESVFLLDSQGALLSLNQTTAQRLGSTPEEMKGKVAYDFLPKETANSRREKIEEVFRTGREARFEDNRDGNYFKHALYPVLDEEGKVSRLAVFSQSVTGLKMAEQALHESEGKARALLEATNEAVALYDREGILLDLNDAYARMMHMEKGEITGKCMWEYFPPDVSKYRKAVLEQVFSAGQPVALTEEVNSRVYDTRVYPILNAAGLTARIAIFARDITERKRAEDELKASHARLRELSRHLETAREQERIRIARGIHDELGQVLTAIILETSWLAKKLPKRMKSLKSRADAAADLATGAIQAVRKIIAELRPALLNDLGLAEAIKWQAGEYRKRTGIECAVSIDLNDTNLNNEISTAVFRIFQESFTNVIRHAKATEISVSLKESEGEIELTVEDNGIGLDGTAAGSKDTFGIIGMKERAQALGGNLDIVGTPEKGTRVAARIPVNGKPLV